MNTAIWIIQGITAAMFLMAGITKSTQPKEKLEPKLPWVKDFSLGIVRLVGISELSGANNKPSIGNVKVTFGDKKISFGISRADIAGFALEEAESGKYIKSMPIIGS